MKSVENWSMLGSYKEKFEEILEDRTMKFLVDQFPCVDPERAIRSIAQDELNTFLSRLDRKSPHEQMQESDDSQPDRSSSPVLPLL